MPPPHPATPRNPSLPLFLLRYFTGHHLDGRHRTNATWFKRGTAPSHHLTWWTAKPRFHRMIWRINSVIVPTGWIIAYKFSPTYGINLTVLITLCLLPYLFHHGIMAVIRVIPRHTVVYVNDNIRSEDVDTDLVNVAIPEQIVEPDDIQDMLDHSVQKTVAENATRRTRRSS